MNRDASPERFSKPNVLSFGTFAYKRPGIKPKWIIVDCRSLANPYYMSDLALLSGSDDAVYNFVRTRKREVFDNLVKDVKIKIRTCLEEEETARKYTIAFGCTGGKHRSVAMCRHMQAWCKEKGIDYKGLGNLN